MIFLLLFLNVFLNTVFIADAYKVIYAINAGGDEHQGSDGIFYQKDPLSVGTASDYGKNLLMIGRVSELDEILYQTERYHSSTFGYDLPANQDGEYVLVLKFCEVYFNAPNQKVFDVILNGDHTVVADLDIFSLVGRGTAHDEYIYFSVSRGKLYYKEEESEIRNGKIRIEFIKGYRDNPKINAIALIKGDVENIPKLPPLNVDASTEAYADIASDEASATSSEKTASQNSKEQPSSQQNKVRKTSGPKQPNPYSLDESSMMLPIFVALGLFIPLLFCLCKL
ncbi:malectin [Culicoides brevitarsis]|uniref:malectin n=1 Tax=Culicoides brevitarsis TaxID=469753 RepID=UPI00307B209A